MYLLEATGTIITANVAKHVPEVSEKNDSYLLSASLFFSSHTNSTKISCVYYWLLLDFMHAVS
jgi:hypothetical protein